MKFRVMVVALAALLRSDAGEPANAEDLQYSINWPSGLSLGEGRLKAVKNGAEWSLEFRFDASIPGFSICDRFQSRTDQNHCSLVFDRELQHGKRVSHETITFDQAGGKAVRETKGGGKSAIDTTKCAKDALAFLSHVRHELAQGRIPPAQDVFYGAAYRVRLEYKGTQKLRLGEGWTDTDRLIAHIKGPASDIAVEAFFAKDENRTPVVVKVPLKAGVFSMEIVR